MGKVASIQRNLFTTTLNQCRRGRCGRASTWLRLPDAYSYTIRCHPGTFQAFGNFHASSARYHRKCAMTGFVPRLLQMETRSRKASTTASEAQAHAMKVSFPSGCRPFVAPMAGSWVHAQSEPGDGPCSHGITGMKSGSLPRCTTFKRARRANGLSIGLPACSLQEGWNTGLPGGDSSR